MQKYRILHNIYCTGNDQRQRLVLNIQDATLRIGLLYHVRLLNTDDSHINNYSSKPSMFMKHLLEKELKKYLKSTNNIEDSSDEHNTIKRCVIITVWYKDFSNFFSSSCLELDNFDTLLREEHIGLSEAADIMTCLCPICLPLKTPLSTKLDNFCFNSRLRDENGGHTFSLTSAEKLLIFCSRLGPTPPYGQRT